MSKVKIIVIIYIVLSMVGIGIAMKACSNERNEKLRAQHNFDVAMTDAEFYRTENGLSVSKVKELELTKSEFEKYLQEQTQTIKDLKLKLKRVESVSSIGTVIEGGGKTNLKDSIIYDTINLKDSTLISKKEIRIFNWSDQWSKIWGEIYKDSIQCKYQVKDSLEIILYRVPRQFLFIKWGTKYYEQIVISKNPNSTIVYNKRATIVKKYKKRKGN